MSKKINSIIVAKDGKYEAVETLQQIQEQSQKGDLLLLHLKEAKSNNVRTVLLNVDEVAMAVDLATIEKAKENAVEYIEDYNQHKHSGDEFFKGFASYLYNKYGKDD